MGSFPKRHSEVTPIDLYSAIQREYGLDQETINELRRSGTFINMTTDRAVHAVNQLLKMFGPYLTKQLLVSGQLRSRDCLPCLESRASFLINAGDELSSSNVVRMIIKEPRILESDDMTFMALLDSAKKLIPNRRQRGIFLYSFPHYFALPPLKVSGFVKSCQPAERFKNRHLALWTALVIHCMEDAPSAQPLTVATLSADRQAVVATKSPAADDEQAARDATPRAAISMLLDSLGYDGAKRDRHIRLLVAWIGSEEAVLDMVRKLVAAGWNAHALDTLLSHRNAFAPETVDRLMDVHDLLVNGFGLQKRVAAYIASLAPSLTEIPVNLLRARICAALGASVTPRAVERLMLNAPAALRLSAEELVSRRANLEMRGIRAGLSPRRILQKAAELPPEKSVSEEASEPPPPVVVEPAVPVCTTAIQALESAGWNRRDAMLHLRAFTGLKDVDPAQLLHSLLRLKADLNLSGAAFTRRLNENTRALVFNHDALAASYDPAANGKRRTLKEARGRLTPDQTAEAMRTAVGVHALDPGPKWSEHTTRQALSILRLIGLTGKEAKTFLGKHPELLTDDGRPMAVAYWLMTTYCLEPECVRKNLDQPDSRMALFLHPETLRDTINERRRLGVEYERLHIHSSFLDPCLAWSRVFCPLEELAFRLEFLLELGARPNQNTLKQLHAASRVVFLKALKQERSSGRRY